MISHAVGIIQILYLPNHLSVRRLRRKVNFEADLKSLNTEFFFSQTDCPAGLNSPVCLIMCETRLFFLGFCFFDRIQKENSNVND